MCVSVASIFRFSKIRKTAGDNVNDENTTDGCVRIFVVLTNSIKLSSLGVTVVFLLTCALTRTNGLLLFVEKIMCLKQVWWLRVLNPVNMTLEYFEDIFNAIQITGLFVKLFQKGSWMHNIYLLIRKYISWKIRVWIERHW